MGPAVYILKVKEKRIGVPPAVLRKLEVEIDKYSTEIESLIFRKLV